MSGTSPEPREDDAWDLDELALWEAGVGRRRLRRFNRRVRARERRAQLAALRPTLSAFLLGAVVGLLAAALVAGARGHAALAAGLFFSMSVVAAVNLVLVIVAKPPSQNRRTR